MPPASKHRNRLLAALTSSEITLLNPHLRPVALKVDAQLEAPNEPIRHIYFPESATASVIALGAEGSRVEVGTIGCEGMTGLPVLTGGGHSPNLTFIQMPGEAQKIGAAPFQNALKSSPSLHSWFLKYVQVFMIQTAHTAMANSTGSLEERLARWLLMAHDRVDSDEVPLTHEFLSLMLAVRRAGVTVALNAFVMKGLIRTHRHRITILDREGIEEIAGEYYGTPEKEWERLIASRD